MDGVQPHGEGDRGQLGGTTGGRQTVGQPDKARLRIDRGHVTHPAPPAQCSRYYGHAAGQGGGSGKKWPWDPDQIDRLTRDDTG